MTNRRVGGESEARDAAVAVRRERRCVDLYESQGAIAAKVSPKQAVGWYSQ